jgi:hypothetical protein
MDASVACGTDRSVVAVFDDRNAAEMAVDSLRRAGFPHDSLGFAIRGHDADAGMLTDSQGTKDGKGLATGMISGGLIGGVLAAAVAAIPGFGPILAGGILASFVGGAIAGTAVGGILGALTGLGISEEEARFYQKHFDEGRAIVAVRAGDRFTEAGAILRGAGGQHIHCEVGAPVQTHGVFNTP